MERKKGRLAFWTKCFHCNKDVFFFRDDNDGSAVFDEPGHLWIKHDCQDDSLSAEEISAYVNAFGRRLQNLRTRARQSLKSQQQPSRFHATLFNAPALRQMTLSHHTYIELEVTDMEGSLRKVYFPQEHIERLQGWPLAEIKTVTMTRGNVDIEFAKWVVPFLHDGQMLTDLPPSQEELDGPATIRKPDMRRKRLNPFSRR
jgi:hypothetical protein